MAYDPDEEDFDDEYFSEVLDGAELTGKEPKFLAMAELNMHHAAVAELKVDELIKMYRSMRDQLATDRKGYKQREAKVKMQMSIVSMCLRDAGDRLGVDTFSTADGTAFRNVKEKFTIRDWEVFTAWLDKTKYWQAIQKRVSPLAIKDIREKEGLPPGVDVLKEIEFSVRSPTAGRKRKT